MTAAGVQPIARATGPYYAIGMGTPIADNPTSGRIVDGEHRYACRVFFEDTDLTGAVYHANYLRFMERARTEMLRAVGIDQRPVFEAGEGSYAVTDLRIRYVQPAKLDDLLIIHSKIAKLGPARTVIHQRVMLNDAVVAEAEVTVAFLNRAGRPRRQPADWVEKFRSIAGAD